MRTHLSDHYVQQALAQGYRSRAAFKLIELADRDRLLGPGLTVVDLGAVPGSWSQVIAARVLPAGRVIALDMIQMEPIQGVEFILGDFGDAPVLARLEAALGAKQADLVLSDMAPNLSGVAASDQARAVRLGELALDFAKRHLQPRGALLVKAFQGAGYPELLQGMRQAFESVASRKPKASRGRSTEMYLLGKGVRRGCGGVDRVARGSGCD